MNRRTSLSLCLAGFPGAAAFGPRLAQGQDLAARERPARLPLSTTFKGKARFEAMLAKAEAEDWKALPVGERMVKFAQELHHRPYTSFTLEIHDHVESPSVNLDGVDCWTFFEQCLGLARMIAKDKVAYTEQDLLDQIEFTRYRAGYCSGDYLDRIHYLAEWFIENDARGVAEDITQDLGYAKKIEGRKIQEMTILWKSYRYLKNNPDLRPLMTKSEAEVAALPVYYIPKDKVARIEDQLEDGDVFGIATNQNGGFCSHVGLGVRTDDGVMRIMHASSKYKKVIIDKSISGYLNAFKYHMGVIVGRPLEVEKTIYDTSTYEANLKKILSAG